MFFLLAALTPPPPSRPPPSSSSSTSSSRHDHRMFSISLSLFRYHRPARRLSTHCTRDGTASPPPPLEAVSERGTRHLADEPVNPVKLPRARSRSPVYSAGKPSIMLLSRADTTHLKFFLQLNEPELPEKEELQRPCFCRREETQLYTFERPPGGRGLRKSCRPIARRPIRHSSQGRRRCPRTVTANDRLTA